MSIDVICLIVFVYGFWQGWNQGIIGTVLNIVIYTFGAMLAYKMAPITSSILERLFDNHHPLMYVAGMGANLLLIIVVVRLATEGLEEAAQAAFLGWANRLGGGMLIGVFFVLLYSVLLWFATQGRVVGPNTLAESRTYDAFLKDMPVVAKKIVIRFQPLVADVWTDSNMWMDKIRDYGVQKTESSQKVYDIPDEQPVIERTPEVARPRNAAPPPANDNGIVD